MATKTHTYSKKLISKTSAQMKVIAKLENSELPLFNIMLKEIEIYEIKNPNSNAVFFEAVNKKFDIKIITKSLKTAPEELLDSLWIIVKDAIKSKEIFNLLKFHKFEIQQTEKTKEMFNIVNTNTNITIETKFNNNHAQY